MLLTERRQKILDLLHKQGSIQIANLSESWGVSPMTIHRDLDALATAGKLEKVRGGAVLPVLVGNAGEDCPACHMRIRSRTQVVIHLIDGRKQWFCCPHCGLLGLSQLGTQVNVAMVTDFLHGRMISAEMAFYVVDPALSICCMPTTLAFLRQEEAERFQQGFGGQVLPIAGTIQYIQAAMRISGQGHRSDLKE